MKFRVIAFVLLLAIRLPAADVTVTKLVAEGAAHTDKGETLAALKSYQDADHLTPNDPNILCLLAKEYCNAMQTTKDAAVKEDYAQKALATAQLALKAGPNSPKTHCSVAVCYAKNFPYLDNQTKVDYSRQIKAEADKAIELDPKFDLAYHMLGRWNFEVSNMGVFVRGIVRIAYGGLPKASKEIAIENFKKAVGLMPGRIVNHLQLARMYHVTSQENLVADELKQCTSLTPMDMDDKEAQAIAKKILAGEKWPTDF